MSIKTFAQSPWWIAIRPKTLTAGLSPVVLGFSFALNDGYFNSRILTMVVIATLAIQITTNLVNDYFDYIKGIDDQQSVGFSKVLVEGSITLPAMRRGIFLMVIIAALASTYLILKGGLPIALIAISALLFAFMYTAGPFPLGHIGLADIVEFIYFGPIATAGTYYLLSHRLTSYAIIGGLIPGCLSLAILTVDNLRDYHTDMAKGKKTLCVRFGIKFAKTQYYCCVFIGFLIPLFLVALTQKHLFSLGCFALLPLYKTCLRQVKENQKPKELNKTLAQTAALLLLFTLLFSAGWMI